MKIQHSLICTAAAVVCLALLAPLTAADSGHCFVPNGDASPDTAPCPNIGGNTGACCPQNWACFSNGLCYNSGDKTYGRYACTSNSWGDGCPDYCTNGTGYAGNEAVVRCSDGHWCCDGDGSFDCCDMDEQKVNIPSGSSVATQTQTPNPFSTPFDWTSGSTASSTSSSSQSSSPASSSASSTEDSSSSAESSSSSSSTSSPTLTPVPTTITSQSISTDSSGSATTIIVVSTAIATPTPEPSESNLPLSSGPSNNTPMIAGIAAGVPAGLIAFALLVFFLMRRRKQNHQGQGGIPPSSASQSTDPKDLVDMYAGHGPSEIDSHPVAQGAGKPDKHTSQVSELSGSQPYPHSPAISSLHSNEKRSSSGTLYSPVSTTNNTWGGPNTGMRNLSQVREEGPVELWGGAPEQQPPAQQPQDFATRNQNHNRTSSSGGYPGYVPYRPSTGSVDGGVEEAGNRTSSGQYKAYRPPTPCELPTEPEKKGETQVKPAARVGAEGNAGAEKAVDGGDTVDGAARESDARIPQSPRSDIDQGTLSQGGLRVVNQ